MFHALFLCTFLINRKISNFVLEETTYGNTFKIDAIIQEAIFMHFKGACLYFKSNIHRGRLLFTLRRETHCGVAELNPVMNRAGSRESMEGETKQGSQGPREKKNVRPEFRTKQSQVERGVYKLCCA